MYKNLLIPTDGSAASGKAVVEGVKLAKSLGAAVTAFFAAPEPTPLLYEAFLPADYAAREGHAELIGKTAAKYLGVIERACDKAGVPCRSVHVTNDSAADAIVAAAKKYKCDLIFMASHGRRGLSGLLLGSQTQKVLTHSKVPVLVYR